MSMQPDPDVKRLGAIVGRWRAEGVVVGDPEIPIVGTDVYEWLAGGYFLVHHIDVSVGEATVQGIELIGEHDPRTGAIVARSYDADGAVTIMHVSIDDAGVMTFTGGSDVAPAAASSDDPGQVVRSTLTVSEDGDHMTAKWERSADGATWNAWMDMTFTRMP